MTSKKDLLISDLIKINYSGHTFRYMMFCHRRHFLLVFFQGTETLGCMTYWTHTLVRQQEAAVFLLKILFNIPHFEVRYNVGKYYVGKYITNSDDSLYYTKKYVVENDITNTDHLLTILILVILGSEISA